MPIMAVLKHLHPMIGVDFHDEISPPGVPVPSIPHLVAGILCFPPWGVVTGKCNSTVWTTTAMSLAQGTDMGFFIPHIPLPPAPANILAPIITLASGSKSHFGAQNHKTPAGPLAFACLVVVNLNLNCGGPTRPPLPSGFVLAVFQLTWQGVTWGDIIAGALHMLVDALVQFGINRFLSTGLGGKALNWLTGKIAGAIASRVSVMGVRLSTLGVTSLGDLIQAVMGGSRLSRFLGYGFAEQLPGILAGLGVGTPIGYSPDLAPTSQGGNLADKGQAAAAHGIDSALDRMFNSPTLEQHPSAPPTPDAGTGGGSGVDPGSSGGAGGSGGSGDGGPSATTASGSGGTCGPDDDPGGSGGSGGDPTSTPTGGSGGTSGPGSSGGSGGSGGGASSTPSGGPGETPGSSGGSGGSGSGASYTPAGGSGGTSGPSSSGGSGGSGGGANYTPADGPGGTSGAGGSSAPSGSSSGPNYTPASGPSEPSATGGGASNGNGTNRSGGGN